ncbi:MAG: B12-binding domain-containing radical SAM protein, partial [Actinomycetota bacterium]|nr:B12-binding domain-containing radical SAM protein [Actinomycetota bacterium]
IRTVATAFGAGWRQVKLYFMCGLPTETDEDVLEIAHLAQDVIRAGREASGSKDIRCTVSIGAFVPKPHTPFQWAAQEHPEVVDGRLRQLRAEINTDGRSRRQIGMRYHDGKPALIEGLLSRGDRRVGRVIERVWREGGRFDGWGEYFSYQRWVAACAVELEPLGVSLAWFTTRERDREEVLPWDHLDSGLDKDWLWADWEDALDGREQDDCRWTPCFDCGVCPSMGTDIQIGPSGRPLLPITPVGSSPLRNPAFSG